MRDLAPTLDRLRAAKVLRGLGTGAVTLTADEAAQIVDHVAANARHISDLQQELDARGQQLGRIVAWANQAGKLCGDVAEEATGYA